MITEIATMPPETDEWAPPPIGLITDETLEPAGPDNLPFVDLLPYFTGAAEPIRATVAEIWPGFSLFYSGRTNSIHGEPSVGKTNVAICAAKPVLEAGGSVLFIDPEDTPQGVATRARLLGVSADQITRFLYLQNPTPEIYTQAHEWAKKHCPDLVIIDGLAEALAAEGKDENSPGDVLGFFRDRTRPFAEAGAAVVIADHVVKGEGNRRFARGSGAKLGSYNGAVFEVTLGEAYTPTKEGFVRLKIAKDRNGGVGAMGATIAELHFAPDPAGGTITTWQTPPEPGSFRPTVIMEKVVKHLQTFKEDTKNGVCEAVGSKREMVFRAIELLLDEGRIVVEKRGKQTHILKLAEGQK